jgi:hypothetical protein
MIRKASAILIALSVALSSSTYAATPKASPKPTVKTTAKAAAKPATKPATKPVAKPTVKTTAKAKAPVRKAPVKRYTPRKRVIVKPSPKPVWPPKGYQSTNGVYAMIPSGSQLVSLLSSSKTLATTVSQCKAMACSAVYVASDSACTYWEITSKVYGPDPADVTATIQYGTLRTLSRGSKAHEILPVILVSGEPLFPHESIILSTLGITPNTFYTQIAQGKSLTQIAGSKVNAVVSAIHADQDKKINAQVAAGLWTSDQAQTLRDNSSIRIATELTNYNLTVGAITVSCWVQAPTETIPSFVYTMEKNHF